MVQIELPKGYNTWLELVDMIGEDILPDKEYHQGDGRIIYGRDILCCVALEMLQHRPTTAELHALQSKLSWTLGVTKNVHNTILKLYNIAK